MLILHTRSAAPALAALLLLTLGLDSQTLAGSALLPAPADPYQVPRVRVIPVPDFPGAHAIWGSTGRDRRGHIWFGVSVDGGEYSARLFEYDPVRDQVIPRGDVISARKAAGLHTPGERQVKIHSRIVQADDGYLYFASTDEQGERPDGSAPPKWGSHLWRLKPGENVWQHLHGGPGRPDRRSRRRAMDLRARPVGSRALPARHQDRHPAPGRGRLA